MGWKGFNLEPGSLDFRESQAEPAGQSKPAIWSFETKQALHLFKASSIQRSEETPLLVRSSIALNY